MKPFGAQKGHVVDFLFTLALFCVFAASALMVVVIGANVYRQTVRGMDSNYDSRTSLTYLTEKVRQNDAANAVTIRSVGDSPALVLSQQAGERTYETWIYVYDGYLREVFVAQGVHVKPTDGQPIKEQQSFLAEKEGSVLTLTATGTDGETRRATVFRGAGNKGREAQVMAVHKTSRSGLFLLELMIVILFFAVTSAVCVNLFVQAHLTSTAGGELTAATREVQSAAEA